MLSSDHRREYSEVPTQSPAKTGESVHSQNPRPVAHRGLLHSSHPVVSLKAFAWISGALLLFALGLATHLITHRDKTSGSEHPMVTIPQGKLQGYTVLTNGNRTVYAFVGVPYAQPPVGDLRFMPPLAPNPWNGTLNASHEMPVCPQRGHDNNLTGDEDCLYLHIYTPKLPTKKHATLLPVIFWVVGGTFKRLVATPSRYGPDFLLDEDVLLVVPTFRVGVLGFLSTGDEVAPGNYGMKDIVRALEWTQENIKYFGGDPHQVTLAGSSTGGISVSLLTLTNATEGFMLNATLFEEFLENIDVALPIVGMYSEAVSNVTAYTEALKAHYFPDLTANRALLLNNLTRLLGDFNFAYPAYNMLQQRLSVATSSMYHCSFEYRGVFSFSYQYSGGYTNLSGIWHGDDIIYLFHGHENSFGPTWYEYSENDLLMVKKMVKMWTSFVINGEPTPADENGTILWEPYSSSQNYLQIGNESDTGLFVQHQLNQKDRMEFWDHLITAIPWV